MVWPNCSPLWILPITAHASRWGLQQLRLLFHDNEFCNSCVTEQCLYLHAVAYIWSCFIVAKFSKMTVIWNVLMFFCDVSKSIGFIRKDCYCYKWLLLLVIKNSPFSSFNNEVMGSSHIESALFSVSHLFSTSNPMTKSSSPQFRVMSLEAVALT